MIKRVTHAHLGPIWYYLEPLDVPYSPNQFFGQDFFDAYSKTVLVQCITYTEQSPEQT